MNPLPTRNLRRVLCAAVVAISSPSVHAAIVGDYSNRKVLEVYTYEDHGGDVMFRTDISIAGCEGGFWMRPADIGFKANLAALLLAYSTKANVRVWAHNDQL